MSKRLIIILILGFPFVSFGQIFNPSDANICKGGSTSFKSGSLYPSASYKWLMRHNGAWNYVGSGSPFSGASSTTLSLTNVSDTLNGDSFKCEVTFGSSVVGISKAACLTVSSSSSTINSASASVNPVDCPGGSTQLSVNGSLSGGSSWKWYMGSCAKNPVSSLVKPDSTTTYYARAEGTCGDTTSCVSVKVVVTNKMSIAPNAITASPTAICAGQSSKLSVSGGSLGSGAIWKWYSGSTCSTLIDSSGVSSLAVSPTSTSSFSVKAVGKCGTTACKFVSVTVYKLPSVNAGIDTSVCLGSTVKINATATNNCIYTWNPSAGLNDTTTLKPNANPKSATSYTLTVTDVNKCSKSDTILVKVNPLPIVKKSNDTTICKGNTAQLNATGGTSYIWLPTDGLDFPNKSNPKSTVGATTNYKVQVTDKNGCTESAQVLVTVNPSPQINANNDTAICEGKSVLLHAGGGTTYNWSPSSGLDFTNISNPKASPALSTSYTVKVTNANGCTASDTVLISVNPYPTVNAGADLIICNGNSVQLSTNAGTGYTYSWSPALSLVSPNTRTPLAKPASTETYHVMVNLNGCISSDSVKVSVINGPKPLFTHVDSMVCKNSSSVRYCGASMSNNFKWSVNNGTIMSGQGTSCIYVHWSATASSGSVTLQDSLNTNPSCPAYISHQIHINGGPAPAPATIVAKGNKISSGILVCKQRTYTNYEWGFESKSTHVEQKSCSGDTLCNYSGGIDTNNFSYWVKVGNDKACLTKSYFNQPGIVNWINPITSKTYLAIYPNPANDKLTIESSSQLQSVIIDNLFGQIINNAPTFDNSNKWILDISGLTNGVYFISIKTDEGLMTRKILKN